MEERDRLNQYFELGGEEYKCDNNMLFDGLNKVFVNDATEFDESNEENVDANSMMDVVKRHVGLQSRSDNSDVSAGELVEANHFKSRVGDRFASFGGLGTPTVL